LLPGPGQEPQMTLGRWKSMKNNDCIGKKWAKWIEMWYIYIYNVIKSCHSSDSNGMEWHGQLHKCETICSHGTLRPPWRKLRPQLLSESHQIIVAYWRHAPEALLEAWTGTARGHSRNTKEGWIWWWQQNTMTMFN
jgi:hypothetical protein